MRKTVGGCRVCSEAKPNFCKPPSAQPIKETQWFERLDIGFKGPLPSSKKNLYLLTIADEFSCFPFSFPCAKTAIAHFNQLFALFGMPAYIHSDRGAAFMSNELTMFLRQRGVARSRKSVYNAPGNGQSERYNGILWTPVKRAIKSQKLDIAHWECVLSDALHSIRFLLSTATNATPHERLFHFTHRSTFVVSIPTWSSAPGPVFLYF